MAKPPSCAICSSKIPYGTMNADIQSDHPRFGQPRPDQQTISCACGRILHVACTLDTSIAWHHLWFSNMKMREFIEEHQLVGKNVALCSKCHEELGEQIVATYKALERFSEGARFLEEFGWAAEDRRPSRGPLKTVGLRGTEEDPGFSRVWRRPSNCLPR